MIDERYILPILRIFTRKIMQIFHSERRRSSSRISARSASDLRRSIFSIHPKWWLCWIEFSSSIVFTRFKWRENLSDRAREYGPFFRSIYPESSKMKYYCSSRKRVSQPLDENVHSMSLRHKGEEIWCESKGCENIKIKMINRLFIEG